MRKPRLRPDSRTLTKVIRDASDPQQLDGGKQNDAQIQHSVEREIGLRVRRWPTSDRANRGCHFGAGTLAARSPEREKCASNDECGKQGEQRKFDLRPRKWPQWLGSVGAQILDAHGYEADGWATHRLWQWAQM